MDKSKLSELQSDVAERLSNTPMVVTVKRPEDPDSDDFKNLVGKLKTLADIERDQRELDIKERELDIRREEAALKREEAMIKAAADERKAEVENAKSKRDTAVKLITQATGYAAGYGAIMLTIAAEGDRLLRSKVFQWASKTISKWF